jgi:hypothetical protein
VLLSPSLLQHPAPHQNDRLSFRHPLYPPRFVAARRYRDSATTTAGIFDQLLAYLNFRQLHLSSNVIDHPPSGGVISHHGFAEEGALEGAIASPNIDYATAFRKLTELLNRSLSLEIAAWGKRA